MMERLGVKSMRFLLLIPQMGAGGAEKVLSLIATHMAQRHEVVLATLEPSGSRSFYVLPPAIEQVQLDALSGGPLHRRAWGIVKRLILIRRLLRRRPDVVLSFTSTLNATVILAAAGLRTAVVVSERNDPVAYRLTRIADLARRWTYPRARRVVVQTEVIADHFSKSGVRRISIIPNPVFAARRQARPGMPGPDGRFRVIAVGRLDPQKGFDLLIAAFARVAPALQDWDLVIFGEGAELPSLEAMIAERGLGDRVRLLGVSGEIDRELARSHLMAFPSRFEGFPNALAEAMAAGLPAIGFRGVSGVEELIEHGRTGLVTSMDGTALADALEALMADPRRRELYGQAARLRSATWNPQSILSRWEDLLLAAASPSVHTVNPG